MDMSCPRIRSTLASGRDLRSPRYVALDELGANAFRMRNYGFPYPHIIAIASDTTFQSTSHSYIPLSLDQSHHPLRIPLHFIYSSIHHRLNKLKLLPSSTHTPIDPSASASPHQCAHAHSTNQVRHRHISLYSNTPPSTRSPNALHYLLFRHTTRTGTYAHTTTPPSSLSPRVLPGATGGGWWVEPVWTTPQGHLPRL
ncbi:hypothetical protein C8Q74DRAFT_200643 [Fomes fomentarius]|nr:hypothetical protein C8Q74DRAFT_200643 [Fomes fomentarius]